jgi:hypothetical protein
MCCGQLRLSPAQLIYQPDHSAVGDNDLGLMRGLQSRIILNVFKQVAKVILLPNDRWVYAVFHGNIYAG